MATSKRRENKQPATKPTQYSSAGAPTLIEAVDAQRSAGTDARDRSAQSLAAERMAMRSRNVGMAVGLGALLLVGGLLAFFQPWAPAQPVAVPTEQPTTVPTAQPTTAPTVQPTAVPAAAQPTAVPAAQPTAVPAVQPTAVPAAAQPAAQPTVVPQAGVPVACNAIAGLPVFADAVCIEQDTDQDDGVLKTENTYATTASPDDVRRFYEGAFPQNGWTLQEFSYDVNLGQRQLTIDVEAQQGPTGVFTRLNLSEDGAPATAALNACNAIAGLPTFPNATCIDFDLDNDDGVIKTDNTYTIAASPEEVRAFYDQALAQNGWTPQEFSHNIIQGLRRLQVAGDAQPGPAGTFTRLTIAER